MRQKHTVLGKNALCFFAIRNCKEYVARVTSKKKASIQGKMEIYFPETKKLKTNQPKIISTAKDAPNVLITNCFNSLLIF
jgi:hypothetical protein